MKEQRERQGDRERVCLCVCVCVFGLLFQGPNLVHAGAQLGLPPLLPPRRGERLRRLCLLAPELEQRGGQVGGGAPGLDLGDRGRERESACV